MLKRINLKNKFPTGKKKGGRMRILTPLFVMLVGAFGIGFSPKNISAQDIQPNISTLYVPLIGLTSVPDPLVLPEDEGDVTYYYAVRNFLREVPLTDIRITDDKCGPVVYSEGDDNGDSKLDYSETWRYTCTTKLSATTQSTARATGVANGMTASHTARATVVVGSDNPPPLVSIVNVTKVAFPLTLPPEGGDISFTYIVNNPGLVPLNNVMVTDDKCTNMSGKLGDTNGNNLLDTNEVWYYTCTANLRQTTTNTVRVEAFTNNQKAVAEATLTVVVENTPGPPEVEVLKPDVKAYVKIDSSFKLFAWGIMGGILATLVLLYMLNKIKGRSAKKNKIKRPGRAKKKKIRLKWFFVLVVVTGVAGGSYYSAFVPQFTKNDNQTNLIDELLGWKFPVAKFPATGSARYLAYSDIRDPGGIPQGLPVRLKIPVIGVNSAVEDASITPDGRMDVPAGSVHVAWFALVPLPGEVGSAVIGGHFGIKNNVPFVFYDLDKLKIGDKIYIVDDRGDTLGFVVRRIELFNRNADATTVFTSDDGLAHLNLITCEGIWNKINDNYPERRVIFTDAILSEDEAPSANIDAIITLILLGAIFIMFRKIMKRNRRR